jgi:hypothetical protein
MALRRIRRWLAKIPVIVLLMITFVILGLALFGGYKLYDYTEHNPKFCASCHIMDDAYAKWSESKHKEVNCHDCHQLPYTDRAMLVGSFLLKRPEVVPPRHGKIIVPYTICIGCHLQGPVADLHPIRKTTGHRKHFYDEGVECTQCHGTKLHEFLPEAGFCSRCHGDIKIHAKVMQGFDCLTCHDFLSRSTSTLIPDRSTCLACHQDMDPQVFFPTNLDAPMQFNCNTCHDPHEKILPTADQCLRCHRQVNRFGLHRVDYHQECASCHIRHVWKVTNREVCLNCHQDRRDHRKGIRCDQCHEFRDLRLIEGEVRRGALSMTMGGK